MSICKAVIEALPGIEAGESASGEVRDHLATCEGCRREAARIKNDLEALREDLAVLAPSPFLEDAVVDEARTSVGEAAPVRRHALWVATGLAAMAASLLVAVLLVSRSGNGGGGDHDGAPEDPGDVEAAGPAGIWLPPSAAEVEAARRANPPNFDYHLQESSKGYYRHWHRNASTGLTTFAKKAIQPFDPEIGHRWVVTWGDGGDRALLLVGVPPPGVQVLGKALLDRVGGERSMTGFKEYTGEGGVHLATIRIGAPGKGGALTSIDVILRPDYEGSVLLEEPLARALGLYQFELPGACRIEGDTSVPAHRARARVIIERSRLNPETKDFERLPDLDEVVEIQVRKAAESPTAEPAPHSAGGMATLHFSGELPNALMTGWRLRVSMEDREEGERVVSMQAQGDTLRSFTPAEKALKEVPLDVKGPLNVVAQFAEGPHPACAVYLPTLDFGGEHPRGYRIRMDRTTLSGDYEPGAQVLLSSVWRGSTAIPSRRSVALTTVGKDGKLSFVRCAGEPADQLRMLVRPKAGKARWVDVDMRRQRLVINILENGEVSVRGHTFALLPEGGASAAAARAALEALRRHLTRLAGTRARHGASGYSQLEALIHAERKVPWRHVQWVMQVCAHPDVRIKKLRFQIVGHAGPGLRTDLPEDRGLAPSSAVPPPPNIKVRLLWNDVRKETRFAFRGSKAVATSVVPYYKVVEGAVSGPGSALKALAEVLRSEVTSAGRPLVGEIVAPPPKGGRVPYADVQAVLEVLIEAGVTQVIFEGAAMPR